MSEPTSGPFLLPGVAGVVPVHPASLPIDGWRTTGRVQRHSVGRQRGWVGGEREVEEWEGEVKREERTGNRSSGQPFWGHNGVCQGFHKSQQPP